MDTCTQGEQWENRMKFDYNGIFVYKGMNKMWKWTKDLENEETQIDRKHFTR